MDPLVRRFSLALVILAFYAPLAFAQDSPKPLSGSELMALVAGNSLSETIVQEIGAKGLSFHPDAKYRSLLSDAGADAPILAEIDKAKVVSNSSSLENSDANELLEHLAAAGKLLRAKQYDEATRELTAALSIGGVEPGFVMAEILVRQEKWVEAATIMLRLQRQEPNFPQEHTKLSFLLYKVNDGEAALTEARIALAENPKNAEAHKNAGLALELLEKYSASEQEYQETLRLKPDYSPVRFDLGLMFYYQKKYDQAIVEYKKAITLDPANGDIHYNLGLSFEGKGDLDSAIREYREAVKLKPTAFDPRECLGRALAARALYPDAVKVFREIEEMWPNNPMCHGCLGNALFATDNMDDAEKEFRKAIALDPTDAFAHEGIGRIRQVQKDYDGALDEFRQAEKLDESSFESYFGAGVALFSKNDFLNAVEQLKLAEYLRPSDARVHGLRGEALTKTEDTAGAIAEFKQAVALDPKGYQVMLELAAALESTGNWVESLEEFRQAGLANPYPGPQDPFKAAQGRFRQHIASLKASGKAAEAATLEESIRESKTNPNISEELDAAILKGRRAATTGRFEEIEQDYKEAVSLAEKIQPHDDRLKICLVNLGFFYSGRKDFGHAEEAFQRALKVTEELHGADSPEMVGPLQSFGHFYINKQDYKSALEYFSRAVTIDENAYGETSNKVADSMRQLSLVYLAQKDYANAENSLLRAQRIMETLVGPEGDGMSNLVLLALCNLYNKWDQPDRAEPRFRQMLAIHEKQFGPESPLILSDLTSEAKMLRELGRTEEAQKYEKRMQAIRAATGQPEGTPLAQVPQ